MNNQNIAEIKISYSARVPKISQSQVVSSNDSYQIFINHWNKDTISLFEEFKILLLSRANMCLGIFTVSQGGTTSTVVDAKLVFATALKCNAINIILAHNHPSRNLSPSMADIKLTKKLKEGGKLLDIDVLDHLVLSDEGYYSFADEGML